MPEAAEEPRVVRPGPPSVTEHYERHLAECYGWMVGGPARAIARAQAELDRLGVPAAGAGRVLDLGAGFGAHAIPLAACGYDVTAIDGSATLLAQLRSLDPTGRVRTIERDLRAALTEEEGELALVLCMGDTLTHLDGPAAVEELLASAGRRLASGGRLLLTFRDYTTMVDGELRAFTVRSNETRVATCILERDGNRVRVTDLLHERSVDGWSATASRYRKLCLDPAAVERSLRRAGLAVRREDGPMVSVVATRTTEP